MTAEGPVLALARKLRDELEQAQRTGRDLAGAVGEWDPEGAPGMHELTGLLTRHAEQCRALVAYLELSVHRGGDA